MTTDTPNVAALADALKAEYAAIFGYGPIGPRLRGDAASQARATEAAHRSRRDALVIRLAELGAVAPAAAAAYTLPFAVTDAASALRLAIELEERSAMIWRAVLPVTTGADRAMAIDALSDCAVRATRWRRAAKITPATVPFPGRPA
jgi:hypothetical protein